jgi:hypothetical protein
MKAVRCVHPDKIPGPPSFLSDRASVDSLSLCSGDAELELKLLSEQVFICLSQLYDLYRKAHGL